MERRRFLLTSAAGVLVTPTVVDAQSSKRVARVGILAAGPAASPEEVLGTPMFVALRNLGWTAGQNLAFEMRYAVGQTERLPALAAELVRANVDVIVTALNQETLAAKDATSTIPIVMVLGVLPVQAGLVASLARPGGNVTGTAVAPVAAGKYFELLKEAVPRLTRVAVLWDPTFPGLVPHSTHRMAEAEARKLGLSLASIEVARADDVDAAMARLVEDRPGALFVVPSGPIAARMTQVIDFAARHRLPSIYPSRTFAEAGGLMSYGYDREELARRAASQLDRVLRGAKPADLPVEQPTRYELVINARTARALGLTISPELLARADHLIH
jgi:putative tryptophan/tyrosine transport system substrate-binding protein